MHRDTLAVHAGEPDRDHAGAPVVPDITIASASTFPDLETLEAAMAAHQGYGRWGTANHAQLEAAVAALEGDGGETKVSALAVGSGMAAIAVAVLAEVSAGDHLIAAHDCYGTTLTFLRDDLSRFGVETTLVDVQDLDAVRAAFRPATRILLCEMCTNPLVRVPDLEALAAIAHQAGALLVVDNTVPTPVLCQPIRWGADLVLHSATKNVSGHADVVGGLLAGRLPLVENARALAQTMGPTLSPFEAWLTLRGLRTLVVRMERQTANALALARHLQQHDAVARVFSPALDDSPYAARARQLLPCGPGALFSFELRGGKEAVAQLVQRLRVIRLMPSLGHVATTLSHPASTSHRGLAPPERARAGISDGLVRCSTGLERLEDLIEDLDQALSR
jgi:cystathionine beta-lyase/cystathionine gamma-synthase